MESKRLLFSIGLCIMLVVLWMLGIRAVANWQGWDMTPKKEQPAEVVDDGPVRPGDDLPTPGAPGSDLPSPAVNGGSPATQSAGNASTQPADPTGLRVLAQGSPRVIELGSAEPDDDTYTLGLRVTTRGAGLEQVTLNRFALTVDDDHRYTFQQPYDAALDQTRPLATRSVQLLGKTIDLDNVDWQVEDKDTNQSQVLLYVDIGDDSGAKFRVKKLFRVLSIPPEDGPEDQIEHGGYEVIVKQSLTNLTASPLTARTTIVGPTALPSDLEAGNDRYLVLGRFGGRDVEYEAVPLTKFDEDDTKRTFNFTDADEDDLYWAGQGSIYFNAILRPTKLTREKLEQFVGEYVGGDSRAPDVTTRYVTRELELQPNEEVNLQFLTYFGPKDDELDNAYYAGNQIGYDATRTSPFGCTFCVFQPVVDILKFLLSLFEKVFQDWGMAIIALVVVVRLLLHPITKRAQKNMLRMQKLAPKMQEIKEKYGDDKEKMAAATAELMPEQASAMMMGCLPMMLQTPIWIALYNMLGAQFALRQAEPFYGLTWIHDLSQPDHLIAFDEKIQFFFITIGGFNLLPFVLAVVFYLNIKFQPQPTVAMSDEQKQQQKIMQVMMIGMFPIFLYGAPSGLNIYIITSTIWGICESKLIRRQVKAQEEWEKANPDLVKKKEPAKGGWKAKMAAFQADLAKRAEEAKKQQAAMRDPKKNGKKK